MRFKRKRGGDRFDLEMPLVLVEITVIPLSLIRVRHVEDVLVGFDFDWLRGF